MTQKPLVMDLGMHDGRDTAAYLAQGYRVVAVEADPLYAEAAREKFSGALAVGDLMIEACGLGEEDGDRPFYRSLANTEWSSFEYSLARRDGGEADTLTVPCRHPRFLFEQYGAPHYVKIDLEGADRFVLAALAELPSRPLYLSTEVGGVQDINAVIALGYREFQLVDQSKLPRKGNPSGPFGEALVGEWVSGDAVRAQYCAHRDSGDLRGPRFAWFDLHARWIG